MWAVVVLSDDGQFVFGVIGVSSDASAAVVRTADEFVEYKEDEGGYCCSADIVKHLRKNPDCYTLGVTGRALPLLGSEYR